MCYSDSMKGIIAGTGVDKIEEIKRIKVRYLTYDINDMISFLQGRKKSISAESREQ